MDIANDTRVDAEPHVRPFQFSLRTMFIVTTVVAIVCAGLFGPWEWLRDLTLFYLGVTVPMAVVVALIYSRGYARTFWIGALFPTGVFLLSVVVEGDPFRIFRPLTLGLSGYGDPYLDRFILGVSVLVAIIMIVLAGLIGVGVRWMVESPQRTRVRQAAANALQTVGNSEVSNPTQKSKNDAD